MAPGAPGWRPDCENIALGAHGWRDDCENIALGAPGWRPDCENMALGAHGGGAPTREMWPLVGRQTIYTGAGMAFRL